MMNVNESHQGFACVSFALLSRLSDSTNLNYLSYIIRMVEAVGNSVFLTSSITLVASQFPSSESGVLGVVVMSSGVGIILGPTVDGVLSQLGRLTFPFTVLGGVLVVEAVISSLALPVIKEREEEKGDSVEFGVLRALRLPPVQLAVLSVLTASVTAGSLQANLGRHLASLSLEPGQDAVIFIAYGSSFAILSPMWGLLADTISSTLVILAGSLLLGLGSLLTGPVPGLDLSPHYLTGHIYISNNKLLVFWKFCSLN